MRTLGDSITCTGGVTRIRDTGPGLLGPTASLPPRNALFLQDPPTRAASAPLRRPRDPTLPLAIACAAAMATALTDHRALQSRAREERDGEEEKEDSIEIAVNDAFLNEGSKHRSSLFPWWRHVFPEWIIETSESGALSTAKWRKHLPGGPMPVGWLVILTRPPQTCARIINT